MKRREQTKPKALDEDQCEVQRSEDNDRDNDVLHPNVKFASLKEQALSYGETFVCLQCGYLIRYYKYLE
jgi:hypothetical protein